MKRFILLLGTTVFTFIAISSCTCKRHEKAVCPEPQNVPVAIITKFLPGNKPVVTPVVRLRYGTEQQVIWEIDDPELEFTIYFNKNGSPFDEDKFDNKKNKSGKAEVDPGPNAKFYYYSVDVEGFEPIDPAIIIRR